VNGKTGVTKSEIRNSKSETNPNSEKGKFQNFRPSEFFRISNLGFEFVRISGFGFRI